MSAVRRRAPKGTFDVLAYQRQRRLNPAIAEQQRRTIRMVKRRARLACLMAYGGDPPKCACCGESNIGFLSLDHVNGGGSEHKRALRKCVGNSFYSKLKNLGFPNDPPLQVLCYNCNLGRQNNRGVCPHHGHDHLSPESSTPQPNGSPFVLLGDDGGLFAGMEDVP